MSVYPISSVHAFSSTSEVLYFEVLEELPWGQTRTLALVFCSNDHGLEENIRMGHGALHTCTHGLVGGVHPIIPNLIHF